MDGGANRGETCRLSCEVWPGRERSKFWIARVRLIAVLFAVLEMGLFITGYPNGYESVAWIA
jgi:hypothetical protein